MRWLWLVVLAGCGSNADPCAAFSGRTCISVVASGAPNLRVDQLVVRTSGAFTLAGAPSPPAPRAEPAAPPFQLAVLSGEVDGAFDLELSARLAGVEIAHGHASGTLVRGSVTRLPVELDGGAPDLGGGGDLAGLDLSRPPGTSSCDPTTQQPCGAEDKCIILGPDELCQPGGTQAVGQVCGTDPGDDCARGTQCVFPGSLIQNNGVCEQFCSTDGDCKQAPAGVGGAPEPGNGPHCLFHFGDATTPLVCTVPCNPVSSQGGSGCPTGAACIYASSAQASELTFCDRPGTGTDGQPCDGNFRCAAGFNCVDHNGTRCRSVCRANTNGDCSNGYVCNPGAGGTSPMFGYCCPSTGC